MNKFLSVITWFFSLVCLGSSQAVFAVQQTAVTTIHWNTDCPMVQAIVSEDTASVVSILKQGIQSNSQEAQEWLHAAIYGGNLKIIKALVEAGIPVQDAALFYAIYGEEQKKTVVKYLLGFNLNVNVVDPLNKSTPLIEAIEHNHIDSMKLLLQAGANPEVGENEKGTALMRAVRSENAPAVKLLISHGANLNARNHKSLTPYMVATLRGDDTLMQVLKKAKADIHAETLHDTTTKLMVRIRAGMTAPDIVKQFYNPCAHQLLQKSGTIDESVEECATPLIFAAMHNDVSAIRSMLAENVDVECIDAQGFNALFYAIANGHKEAVALLLDAGASKDVKYHAGMTPAIVAAMCCREDVFEVLEKAGANMEAQLTDDLLLDLDKKIQIPAGSTALDIAARMEDEIFHCVVKDNPINQEEKAEEPPVVVPPMVDPVHEACGE